MSHFRKILVAIKDPHARSQPAVLKAAQVAGASGASLVLFHALAAPVYVDLVAQLNATALVDHERERAAARLNALAARIRRRRVSVSIAVESDYPAWEAVIRQARRCRADLIVAECHAEHRAPWLLQLNDWELLRQSPLPVLLVKNARPYRRPVILAAIDPTHAFAKPGDLDEQILRMAGRLKDVMRGTVHAMHACFSAPTGATAPEILNAELATELQEKAEAQARKAFERAIRKHRIPASRQHLVPTHPFDSIPRTAQRTRADILVMGAVSRSGLRRIFIGNTAERVLDTVTCDVLIVKPRTFASRVQRAPRGMRFVQTPAMYPH